VVRHAFALLSELFSVGRGTTDWADGYVRRGSAQPDTARFACAGMSPTANLIDATDGTPDNPQRIDAIDRYSCS